ncbi:MAG: hypothetical protein GC149_09105 [Gammaproteobacteria bacterium]|nr:hypothetical protein [Gammaproteobacteria bacterium]
MTENAKPQQPTLITGASARRSAALFNYGNLIATLMPLPLGIFWLGASMVVYAMNRHHPNPRVGYYTQWAAYRFYGVVGFVVAEATFYTKGLHVWLITWAVMALILIPWTLYDLLRIYREEWQDTYREEEGA